MLDLLHHLNIIDNILFVTHQNFYAALKFLKTSFLKVIMIPIFE